MQGASLVPILKEKKPKDWRNTLYYHYYEYPGCHMVHRHEGVYNGRYKLMNFYDLGEWELYDLQSDPKEMVNSAHLNGWVIAPYMKIVGEYRASLKNHPNPPAPSLTDFR